MIALFVVLTAFVIGLLNL